MQWLDAVWSRSLVEPGCERPALAIGLLLWPGFSTLALAALRETLLAASALGAGEMRLAILGDQPGLHAVAGDFTVVTPDTAYVHPAGFDAVLVLAGPHSWRQAPCPTMANYLRIVATSGVLIGAVGAGAFVLAEEGLLAGRRVCLDPADGAAFHAAFHGLTVMDDAHVLEDGGRVTMRGGLAILSWLMPFMAGRLGVEAAGKLAEVIGLNPWPAQADMAAGDASLQGEDDESDDEAASRRTGAEVHSERPLAMDDPRIARAVALIESRHGRDVSPSEMARAAGLSARQFSRLFRSTLGMTPKHFILEARLRRARVLLEQGALSISSIGEETGFADSAHFTTAFKARYGKPPRHFRPKR
ncbi:hypothetical protein BJF93_12610 [Xaviernesmea oryzae]|uniref:HTH araC/xylS-type domain-containing protein n=1 Tax=Xaviernesmea oryzae TaxID=464029 RepID=A0A1Q9ARC3_9HYPH|nr:hypothetical protein BJF93_12610 [Xaviernesmea oryzae]